MSEAVIAAAVIVSNGTALLIRRRVAEGELSWQFPAGKVEPGETPSGCRHPRDPRGGRPGRRHG